jgi:hypothetical protein
MDSGGRFSKVVMATDEDGGSVDLIPRAPGIVAHDLGAPGLDDGDNAIDLLIGGGHDTPEDDNNGGPEMAGVAVLGSFHGNGGSILC